jgi:hypothetical protein
MPVCCPLCSMGMHRWRRVMALWLGSEQVPVGSRTSPPAANRGQWPGLTNTKDAVQHSTNRRRTPPQQQMATSTDVMVAAPPHVHTRQHQAIGHMTSQITHSRVQHALRLPQPSLHLTMFTSCAALRCAAPAACRNLSCGGMTWRVLQLPAATTTGCDAHQHTAAAEQLLGAHPHTAAV